MSKPAATTTAGPARAPAGAPTCNVANGPYAYAMPCQGPAEWDDHFGRHLCERHSLAAADAEAAAESR